MDPYAQVHYNGSKHNSKVHSDGGKTPKWNYRLELEVTDVMDEITVKVYNKNTFDDDQIAHTDALKIYNLIGPNNGMTENHHMIYEKKNRGTIKIRSQYTPNAAPEAEVDPAA